MVARLITMRTFALLVGASLLSGAAAATQKVTLVAVGDIQLSGGTAQMIQRDGVDYPFSGTAQITRAADLAVGNLECALSRDARKVAKRFSFKADPASADGLVGAGFDVVSLANNHSLDCGRAGLLDTMQALEKRGILWVGAGRNAAEAEAPLIVQRNGLRIAFLARTAISCAGMLPRADAPSSASFNADRTVTAVAAARKRADIVVVVLHWGLESTSNPLEMQRRIAHRLIDAGAHLVIGHHSHTPQPLQRCHEGIIAYSLGNFVFDNPRPRASHGLMLRCILTRSGVASVEKIPVTINRCRPQPDGK